MGGSCGTGPVLILFWANSTTGIVGTKNVTINKDITPPVVTITSPTSGTFFSINAPTFLISASAFSGISAISVLAEWWGD